MASLTLLFKADEVGPVCNRLSKKAVELGLPAFKVAKSFTNPTDLHVRWGTKEAVPAGVKVINSAEAVAKARDKKASRTVMGSLAPKTWFTLTELKFPCVIRPKTHHAGNRFFVCKSMLEAKVAAKKCKLGWYGSELIDKDTEFRVFVLHGRVVAVSQRFKGPSHPVAWNMALGGKLINLKQGGWPLNVLKASIEATKLIGLDWAALDVAVEKGTGRVVVFEANTAPGLRNPYTMTCIAKAFNWSLTNESPKAVAKFDKWSRFIHPGIKST